MVNGSQLSFGSGAYGAAEDRNLPAWRERLAFDSLSVKWQGFFLGWLFGISAILAEARLRSPDWFSYPDRT